MFVCTTLISELICRHPLDEKICLNAEEKKIKLPILLVCKFFCRSSSTSQCYVFEGNKWDLTLQSQICIGLMQRNIYTLDVHNLSPFVYKKQKMRMWKPIFAGHTMLFWMHFKSIQDVLNKSDASIFMNSNVESWTCTSSKIKTLWFYTTRLVFCSSLQSQGLGGRGGSDWSAG